LKYGDGCESKTLKIYARRKTMKMKAYGLFVLFPVLALIFMSPLAGHTSGTKNASGIERISVEDARIRVQSGKALLVCSYGDDKCKGLLLEGGMLKSEFENKLSSLPKDQEIIFYCG
jgi:hypothetical protein